MDNKNWMLKALQNPFMDMENQAPNPTANPEMPGSAVPAPMEPYQIPPPGAAPRMPMQGPPSVNSSPYQISSNKMGKQWRHEILSNDGRFIAGETTNSKLPSDQLRVRQSDLSNLYRFNAPLDR